MEEQVGEKTIPVFTVLKNGAILKNIFVFNSRDSSSSDRNETAVRDDDEVEEILVVGRHPECDIVLTHPSISRFHLEIRSVPSRQKLFLTDLSSVHGTWITDQKVEPGACVEVKEGDVIRIGGSTRIYRLHWIPLSRAYDIDDPFVSPLDAATVMEQEEENRVIEAENLEITNQILEDRKTASDNDSDLHLDVMSERTMSSVPSDEDPYPTTKEILFPLASSSGLAALARDSLKTQKLQFNVDMQTSPKWDVDTVEVAAENPSDTSKQQSSGYLEDLGWFELERAAEADGRIVQQKVQTSPKWDLDTVQDDEKPSSSCSPSKQQSADYLQKLSSAAERAHEVDEFDDAKGDGILLLNVMSEGTKSSVPSEDEDLYLAAKKSSSSPLARDNIETEKLQLQDDQPLTESFIDIIETKAKNPSKEPTDGWFETSGCSAFELATEAEGKGLYLNGQTSPNSDLDIVAAKAKSPSSSCSLSKQQSGSYLEDFGCSKLVLAAEADGEVLKLNVMSEGVGSPVLIKAEDPSLQFQKVSIETKKLQFKEDVPSSPKLLIGIIETKAGNSSSECYRSKGQINSCIEAWDCSALEFNAEAENQSIYCKERGETDLFSKKVMDAEAEIQSFDRIETDYVTKQVEEPRKLLAKAEGSGETESISRKLLEVSVHLLAKAEPLLERKTSVLDVQRLSDIQTNPGEEKSCENLHHEDNESEISRQVVAVSQQSFPKVEPLIEITTEDTRDLLGTELQSEVTMETDNESLYKKINGETKVESRQVSAVSDCLLAVNERLSRNSPEDIQSLYYGWQSLSESEVSAPTNQKPKTDMSTDSGISEKETYSLREIESNVNNDKRGSNPSILAAENSDQDTQRNIELPSDLSGSQENQTPGSHDVRGSQMRLSTCNVWSRRGKSASVLQIRTNKNEGKQKEIGNERKTQLQIKQTASDKSISLSAHNGAEALVPEIFTPDKENLTPNSHMRKRLQEIGEIKDSKSSSKLSGGSYSSKIPYSIETVPSWAVTEPEIFTPDKENLTPSSHMLKRLREFGDIKELKGSTKATRKPFSSKVVLSPGIHLKENVMAEQKPDLHSMSRKSKVKPEPLALKKKAERAPFQTLLEKPSAQSQPFTEASSSASARNNINRVCRSSSILSDRKSKMKWTIVLDTSSLLDKESRKPLHLLQGLNGTHLVVPRIVLRELDGMKKHDRSLLFRRTPEIVSSALDWIEDCMIKTKWWIQLQDPSEETRATALTPPVTPQSDGSAFPFSLHWNTPEIVSPTSEDQVLECALLYRNRNIDEKLVLLSNDITLKVKAMAEGVICETAQEFYESLVNPFSERFMWSESSPRGRTWNHLDDVVLRERYSNRKKTWCINGGESGAAAKGLKLILLHNTHYGQPK